MANPNPIFRKEALDHLDDAPRTAHRVVLIRPVDRLALVALATVVILATLWSAFGSVSVRVEGDGILLRPRRLADVGADGQLVSSAVLATLSEPALVQQRNQLRARFEALRARDDAADVAAAHQLALQQDSLNRQLAEFDARIAQLEGMVRDHNAARRAVSALRREGLRAQESLLDAQAVAARTRLATSEGLVARGVAAANDLAAARAEVLAATQALAAVREALKSEPLEDLEAALAHDDLLTRLADARANRDAASTRLVSLQREEDLRRSTAAADQALLADQLAAVSLALDRHRAAPEPAEAEAAAPPAEDPLLVAVFMDAAAAKRVSPGMEILVSPGSVERARFGSARGEVTEVSESPVTTALAGALLDNGSVVLLIARLTPDPSTDSGFQWTTASGPPGRLTPGTPVTAQVIVERRRPITWLLPALRNATGTGG
jgi:HlyD family secretion protein